MVRNVRGGGRGRGREAGGGGEENVCMRRSRERNRPLMI